MVKEEFSIDVVGKDYTFIQVFLQFEYVVSKF